MKISRYKLKNIQLRIMLHEDFYRYMQSGTSVLFKEWHVKYIERNLLIKYAIIKRQLQNKIGGLK